MAVAPEPFDFKDGKLGLRAGYRHLFWVYDIRNKKDPTNGSYLNGNNFQLSTFFVGARYSFAEKWSTSFGVDQNRIMGGNNASSSWEMGRMFDGGNWKEIYTEWNPNWSLDRSFSLPKGIEGSISYSGGYHFTTTDPFPTSHVNDRWDNSLMVSLMYAPAEKWMLQPYVRLAHSIYTRSVNSNGTGHRRDLTSSIGMNVVWSPTDRTSVRFSVRGEKRNSNESDSIVTHYSKFDAVTGVTFSLRF